MRFERGNEESPKGHVIIYWEESGKYHATYLAISPTELSPDYIESRLDGLKSEFLLGEDEIKEVKERLEDFIKKTGPPKPVTIHPPLPIRDIKNLKRIAEIRDDDLIPIFYSSQELFSTVAEYYERYSKAVSTLIPEFQIPSLNVEEVMLSIYPEKDKLQYLTKLVGRLRDYVSIGDNKSINDSINEILNMGRYINSDKYRLKELANAAQIKGERGDKLAALYLERCFKLSDEDYGALRKLDETIKTL